MCCTVASNVWVAFCNTSSFTMPRVYQYMAKSATTNRRATADTTFKLSRTDKVLAKNLAGCSISGAKIANKFEKPTILGEKHSPYFVRLPKMSRVSSFVMVRVAALVAFFTTLSLAEVRDFDFFPLTFSLT